MNPIACDSCEARFPVNALAEADQRSLYDQHYHQEFAEELRMLRKVQEYYRRHPLEDGKTDSEVVEYLLHNDFDLEPRLEFVVQQVARLKGSVGAALCPRCQTGRLHVPPEGWDEFTAGDAITWYWPGWHGIDSNGILHVKVSGWQGGAHWNGETAITPVEPDYDFWCWLIAQEEYHRLVEESEMPAIREVWLHRSKG